MLPRADKIGWWDEWWVDVLFYSVQYSRTMWWNFTIKSHRPCEVTSCIYSNYQYRWVWKGHNPARGDPTKLDLIKIYYFSKHYNPTGNFFKWLCFRRQNWWIWTNSLSKDSNNRHWVFGLVLYKKVCCKFAKINSINRQRVFLPIQMSPLSVIRKTW